MEQLIDPAVAAGNELLFYPHLMGDKTLYADPDLRGAFLGRGAKTGCLNMVYAVMEGLCYSFRELAKKMCLPLSRYGSVKVVGGGARSKVEMQTLANILRVRMEQMDGNVGPAFGIALPASYRCGGISSLDQLSDGTIEDKECFTPQEKASVLCDAKYEKYLRIRGGLRYIMEGKLSE